jgi:hypothetical protein
VRRLALLLLVACCATAPKPRPYPTPPADELLAALKQRQTAVRTLSMETKTTSWIGGDRLKATVLMMADRAGRLRFEAEVALQGTVAMLAVDGRNFTYIDQEHRLFRHGPACPANVALMVPIPLMPQEIAAVLLGDAPVGDRARATDVSWDGKLGADVLAVEQPESGAPRLWVSLRKSASGYDVVAVEGQSAGAPGRWRVAYEDLARADNFTLPGTIRFAEPGKSFDDGVEVKVKQRLAVNATPPDGVFTLAPPPGFKDELLLCPPARSATVK